MRRAPRGTAPWVGVLLAGGLLAACSSTPPEWSPTWQAPGSDFAPAQAMAFRVARSLQEAGDEAGALEQLAPLAEANPDNLELGFWVQDLELERALAADPGAGESAHESALAEQYARRAEERPTAANLILAARLETEASAAQDLLTAALELDPDHPWAHYAMAQVLLEQRMLVDRWQRASQSLARALELDPAHLRARLLETWMLAQEGDSPQAAHALETWLERTAGDPRVAHSTRVEAEVDLALLWVRLGSADEAEDLLNTLEGEPVARARRLAVLAVAQHEQGRLADALDTARRAELADQGAILPVVQQALLFGERQREGDTARSEDHWGRVIEAASDQGDLAGLIQSIRARVSLERAEARRAAAAESTSGKSSGGSDK